MVDSVHEREAESAKTDSDETPKPSKDIAFACFVILVCAISFGMFYGHVSATLSPVWRIITGGALACQSVFMGIIIWEIVRQNRDKNFNSNTKRMAEEIYKEALAALHRQSEAYENMMAAATKAVSMRVASRIVKEMMPHLANNEQKEAALNQAGGIAASEIKTVMSQVTQKTEPLKAKLVCQLNDSED